MILNLSVFFHLMRNKLKNGRVAWRGYQCSCNRDTLTVVRFFLARCKPLMDLFLHCLLLGVSLLLDEVRLAHQFVIFERLDVPFIFSHHEVSYRLCSHLGSNFDVVCIKDVLGF